MLIKLFLVLMIVFAVFSIQTTKLIKAVIYLGIFSLISSFCYLLYNAPDVAIAEAIIGSTISVILYLVALQKYKIFTIYYIADNNHSIDDNFINKGNTLIINLIEQFCTLRELEPQVIYTTEKLESIRSNYDFDLIIRHKNEKILIYGNEQNYQLDTLENYIQGKEFSQVRFIMHDEREEV